jgi:hypothetical protein
VFEANSTAYMVMEYERGESLEKLLKAKKISGEAKLRALIMPLLDGLKVVHEAGFIHRDIKPDNIFLRENGTPVLLDFGSARQAIGVATRTLTALVTPGYAPFEQYDTSTAGEKKQGPWTDIYSLGATLYRAVTGAGPPDAMGRVNAVMAGTDILKPATEAAKGEFSPAFLTAIDWALEFLPENRPQSIDEWRVVLAGRGTRPAPIIVPNVTTDFARAAPTEVHTQVLDTASDGGGTPPAATGTGGRPATGSAGTGSRPSAGRSARKTATTSGRAAPGMVATDRIAPPAPRRGSDQEPKRRDHRSIGRRIAEVTAVVLIIGAMGAWYYLTQPTERAPSRRPIATSEPAEKTPSAELLAASKAAEREAAAEEQARLDEQRAREKAAHEAELEKARAAAERARKSADIERQLREATQDLAADRLTTPADSNAFSRYRAVLALDPANEAALQGLHDILTRYLVLAKAAANENNFDLARTYLDKAGAVSPGAESIAAARVAVDNRMKAREVEKQRIESEARKAAEEERQRMEAARRATEEETHRGRARGRDRTTAARAGSDPAGKARGGLQEGSGHRRAAGVGGRGIRSRPSHVAAGRQRAGELQVGAGNRPRKRRSRCRHPAHRREPRAARRERNRRIPVRQSRVTDRRSQQHLCRHSQHCTGAAEGTRRPGRLRRSAPDREAAVPDDHAPGGRRQHLRHR